METDASLLTAWDFWTNVANWHDPPAEFELQGPFAAGSRGITRMPGHSMHWVIREVNPPTSARIDVALESATLSFEWQFSELSCHRTQLTQKIVLRGPNARTFVSQVEAAFSLNLPDGMAKLANTIAKHEANRRTAGA